MFPKDNIDCYTLGNELKFTILESGNLKEIRKGIVRLNTYVGNNLESTISNIYMRIEEGDKYTFSRLIGIGSPSKFKVIGNKAIYQGTFNEINYTIFLVVFESAFFYKVKIDKCPGKKVTIFYGMDISLSNIYAINSNEAYVSQYIDHKAYLTPNGYVICSRQNQDLPYYLEQGSVGKNIAFATDGFQFFGNDYKITNIPTALLKPHLASEVYQYEFGYSCLQSALLDLDHEQTISFYGYFSDSHPDETTKPLYFDKVMTLFKEMEDDVPCELQSTDLKISFNDVYMAPSLTENELNTLFPIKEQEEYKEEELLSFFIKDKSHLVLPIKESLMERPSGNILISKPQKEDGSYDFERVLATSCYIFGVFNSQIVLGNTSFNKLLANIRNPLNIQKITGQRIFLKIDNKYQLLAMPSLFEMGLGHTKWYYKIKDDLVTITTTMASRTSKVMISFNSEKNYQYDLIITNLLTMSQTENEAKVHVKMGKNEVTCLFDPSSMAYSKYPELAFKMKWDKDGEISDDRIFYNDGKSRNENILSVKLKAASFKFLTIGYNEVSINEEYLDVEKEKNDHEAIYQNLLNDFNLELSGNEQVDSFNYLAYWYSHNVLIHYLSPHGLEQYNGAAWGTRDVCQGPAEFFIAMNKFDEVKRIILNVYKHQFIENGSFPQWFMFDRFSYIQDSGSHGDIIIWPARLLSIYLEKTNDYTILDEMIVYTNHGVATYTKEEYPLIHHLLKQIDSIKKAFIKGTYLSCYGGGDWDDTLQPAHLEDRNKMVSGWTVSLTYEMFWRLSKGLKAYSLSLSSECETMANHIKEDYHKYLIKDGIPAGFIKIDENEIKYIIHPSDKVTKINYRLLPFTRGIISEIFDYEEAVRASKIVNSQLMFPDGVRLMDNTVTYKGGIKTFFNRAETAANFGREIGLQYCHTHIRYCEAMQTLGLKEEVYAGMLIINPIIVTKVVKNALPRQRNSYYSSSDGAFLNRYEAMKDFNKLKTGEIKVKGGWRIYSSGPGIYLSTLITKMLGINVLGDQVMFDPVLPKELNGLIFKFKLNKHNIIIKYYDSDNKHITVNGKELNGEVNSNAYRKRGFMISLSQLKSDNEICLYL